MKAHPLFRIFLLFLCAGSPAALADDKKSQEDKVAIVDGNDAEMNAAIAKARASLPAFWQIFDKREHGEKDFFIKVRIDDGKEHEHFWTKDVERKDGKIFATIDNDAEFVKNVKLGQRIEVPEANISDWLYVREGKTYGCYTIRALFKKMDPKEVEYYKKLLAEP